MKKSFIKCSDERNRIFSVITEIGEEDGRKVVTKEAAYPEGISHIRDIMQNPEVLERVYAPVKACPVVQDGPVLNFEFIEGETLEDRYRKAVEKRSRDEFEANLTEHCRLLTINPENEAVFEGSADFFNWFGDAAVYEGQEGFKIANFDAIAGNIIYRGPDIYFIDYEWVMKFSMPKDLVIYHSVHDLYYHIDGLEEFYPIASAMDYLGVRTDIRKLEASYIHFWNHVILEADGSSLALGKQSLLKPHLSASAEIEETEKIRNQYTEVRKSALLSAKMWRTCSQAIEEMQTKVARFDQTEKEYANLINEYKKLDADRNLWKKRYELVVGTKSWKAVNKVRKVLGRNQ
ncbi:MAG: hypothetical protein LKM35_02090 [Lachnospiraceae bacterium]|jgi:hypothetical protein|nr:hypothetical protein [Lachnospiraceae bacterium]